jgi:hypothetical protein
MTDEKQLSGREKQFAKELQVMLQRALPEKYLVQTNKSLLYKLEVDVSNQLRPTDHSNPKRGQFAFQTDILIEQAKIPIPLVVIELKFGGFSTHDIITYSSKATRHKEIYPYLRYGFVVGGSAALSKKFLTHNQGVDFAMAIPDLQKSHDSAVGLIERQIANAEILVEMMRTTRTTFVSYEKNVHVET